MKYKIAIFLWIIFLLLFAICESNEQIYNKIINGSESISYVETGTARSTKELYSGLKSFDNIEFFLINYDNLGNINIYGNNIYYQTLKLSPPNDNEYYGKNKLEKYKNIGVGPYMDLLGNIYYFSLSDYNIGFNEKIPLIYYRSDDKKEMYEVEKYARENGLLPGEVTPDQLSLVYYIIFLIMNLFFLILTLMLMFVDINSHNKEITISKILGYEENGILVPKFFKHTLYSLSLFSTLLIPTFIVILDKSHESIIFLKYCVLYISIMYIITTFIYVVFFWYFIRKSNLIKTLKGEIYSTIINITSISTNIITKIVIIGVLIILMLPSYQLIQVYTQYNKYIKGNEDFIKYNIQLPEGSDEDMSSIYEKYNSSGAIVNNRINNSINYDDSNYFFDNQQIMVTNSNYMKLINFPMMFKSDENYLLVPDVMKDDIKNIEKEVENEYRMDNYILTYYNDEPIYTYNPIDYSKSMGYINYPIILVLSTLEDTNQDVYIMQNMYYRESKATNDINNLTFYFNAYSQKVILFGTIMLVFFLLFALLIVISLYYMISSYLQVNGKEIAIKKILGYSNFNLYKTFYILDFICYFFGSIGLIIFGILLMVPIWYIGIFIFFMILFNEMGRKLIINKVEKRSIINIIKGES